MKKPVPHKDVGPKTKLAALRWHQERAFVHPLTCGNDSSHRVLEGGMTSEGNVYMECPDCDYIQDWIPDYVWQLFISRMSGGAAGIGTYG